MSRSLWAWTALLLILPAGLSAAETAEVRLKSRTFRPTPSVSILDQMAPPATGESRYVLVQVRGKADAVNRQRLADIGVELLRYVPDQTWIARLDARAWERTDVRSALLWVGILDWSDKVPTRLLEGRPGDWAIEPDGRVRLRVRAHESVDRTAFREALEAANAEILRPLALNPGFLVRLDPNDLEALAGRDEVLWISEDLPEPEPDNDGTRVRIHAEEVQSAPLSLTGFGVTAAIMDGGPVQTHPDFFGRLTNLQGTSPVPHATHVAGTLGGSGTRSQIQGGTPFQWRGVAPDVLLVTWDYFDDVITEMGDAIASYGVAVHSNSWGFGVNGSNCELYGDYDLLVPDLDALVAGASGRRVPIVFSAGNERDDGDCPLVDGGYGCLNPPKAAKNIIVVGATNSDTDTMTEFSSWGPTDDGRLKPDFCAPGCESGGERHIHSTLPTDTYGGSGWCGTSMAAPVVSGSIAVLREAWESISPGTDPEPSLYKAVLAATARDVGNPFPDYAFGHGRIDLEAAAYALLTDSPQVLTLDQDESLEFDFHVRTGVPEVRLVLAWDDPAALPLSDPALINDLDLVLISPNGTHYEPWVLDPAQPSLVAARGADSLNNMEQVSVLFPQGGAWKAVVTGTNVPEGPQIASLVGMDVDGPAAPLDLTLTDVTETSLAFTWSEDRPLDFEGTMAVRYTGTLTWPGPNDGQVFFEGQTVGPGAVVAYARVEDHSTEPWIDEGLTPETTYGYVFYSYDDARNYAGPVPIEGTTSAPSSVDGTGPVTHLELGGPRPNPATGRAEIRFAVPEAGEATVRIYDPAGRRVRVLLDGRVEAGRHELVWDGQDDQGRPVGSGIYFYELRTLGERLSRQLSWSR